MGRHQPIYERAGVAPKRNVFLGKNSLLIQPLIKEPNIFFTQAYISINLPTPDQKLYKRVPDSVVTRVLYNLVQHQLVHAIFCSVKFQVVYTCISFGDIIYPLTNRKMIKIVIVIDLHIVLTYVC